MKLLKSKKTSFVIALSLIGGMSGLALTSSPNYALATVFQSTTNAPIIADEKQQAEEKSYILQGLSGGALVAAVEGVGGVVSREFPIINAISAVLTTAQVTELGSLAHLRVTQDRSVVTTSVGTGALVTDTFIANQTNASLLHAHGVKGDGIMVAVLDSGILLSGTGDHLRRDSYGARRVYAKYDATQGLETRELDDDQNGHGSHITSIIASNIQDAQGHYNGIAPDVDLMSIKAFDEHGDGTYSTVLDGLNWVYNNRHYYHIRVLNLSLGADVQTSYWDDPINQAVMRLWDAGIVVVTSAGNNGSDLGTVSVPGNNPYIITVGAVTDNYTPYDFSDDRVATFSARGPTYEGFVKPEIVAYGARIRAKLDTSMVTSQFSEVPDALDYHGSSGTSQAAAVITGTVALMLQMDSTATPDDIKCRLLSTAKADFGSNLDASPFVQGAGLVDTYSAAVSTARGCANLGLDIQADLQGITHFRGPTRVDESGELVIQVDTSNVTSEANGWGVSSEANGWGIYSEANGWGVYSEANGWGVSSEANGWGVTSESNAWGVSSESNAWGVTSESNAWGISSEANGWGVSTEADFGIDLDSSLETLDSSAQLGLTSTIEIKTEVGL